MVDTHAVIFLESAALIIPKRVLMPAIVERFKGFCKT